MEGIPQHLESQLEEDPVPAEREVIPAVHNQTWEEAPGSIRREMEPAVAVEPVLEEMEPVVVATAWVAMADQVYPLL